MEEAIKKSWESSFKNILDSIDKERTVEEVAAMFFELGWKAGVENMNGSISAATKVLGEISRKRDKHHELTLQLWNMLTKEEIEKGYVYITYEVDVSTLVRTGSSMVDEVLKKSPYRDHVIGFKRERGNICVSLDEEGQKKWEEEYNKIAEFYKKY